MRLRRFSFRTRLTVAITAVFLVTGIALIVAQNIALNWMLDQTVTAVQADHDAKINVTIDDDGTASARGDENAEGVVGLEQADFAEATDQIADTVIQGVMLASVGILIVFVAIAVLASIWLARRATRRIAEVTAATNEITEHDLHKRLALPGPKDEITDLGDTIDQMLGRLETAFASQDRFIANASHELRTPLATTRTALQVPLRQGRVDPELIPEIERALNANRRSEELIVALLTLARGRFTNADEHTTISLDEIVEQEIGTLDPLAADKDIRIVTSLDDATITGQPILIAQLAHNLIQNAILYSPAGSVIEVTLCSTGSTAMLSIRNPGSEISHDEAALLTEPFHRGTNTRTNAAGQPKPGFGLGLSIVAAIASTHSADMSVKPREGGGLTVDVTFPVMAALSS